MSVVVRYSEPVSPSGGLQAKGLANLLGAPTMDPITLVLREAAQNAWDARLEGQAPSLLVRVRTLRGPQRDALRALLLAGSESSGEPPEVDQLTPRLGKGEEIPVLEICDFGTHGLSGSPDPVKESSRFVRFFFDIGSPHFDGSTGGTYGFGRASLYLAGLARTILVDSQVAGANGPRRVMACRLGDSYVATSGEGRGNRHTGRHFWGASVDGRSIRPIEGRQAVDISEAVGFPRRDGMAHAGTSILIPWPEISMDAAAHCIPQILYHNLWPKLVPVDGRTPMELRVDLGDGERSLSLAGGHPVYECFATALAMARTRRTPPAAGVGPKTRRNPAAHVGAILAPHVMIGEGLGDPHWPDPLAEFRGGLAHVALMRASELVVTYKQVDIGTECAPWVGVVLAESSPADASAFAAAEPPAHDDWNPAKLKGAEATTVRMTLKYLSEGVRACLGIRAQPLVAAADAPSLADAADYFSEQFLAGDGSAAGHVGGAGGGASGRSRNPISAPEFIGLEVVGGKTVARYRVEVRRQLDQAIQATTSVAIEGGTTAELPPEMTPPRVIGWTKPDGTSSQGGLCSASMPGNYEFAVSFGGSYAVTVDVELGGDVNG